MKGKKNKTSKLASAGAMPHAMQRGIVIHSMGMDRIGYSKFADPPVGEKIEVTWLSRRSSMRSMDLELRGFEMRTLPILGSALITSKAPQPSPFLDLVVDAKTIASLKYKGVIDLSAAHAQWYCFKQLFRAGSSGVADDVMLKGYPGKRSSCRQTLSLLNERLGLFHVSLGRADRRRFLQRHPDCLIKKRR